MESENYRCTHCGKELALEDCYWDRNDDECCGECLDNDDD